MNMFARFDENPAVTLQVIKETKRYGWTHARTDNMKTIYPPQTKFAGGYKYLLGIITCDPLMFTMDLPKFIVSNQKEKSISVFRV